MRNKMIRKELRSQEAVSQVLGETKDMFGDMYTEAEKRLKEANILITKLEEKVFIEEQKRGWCEMEISRLRLENNKLKRRKKL